MKKSIETFEDCLACANSNFDFRNSYLDYFNFPKIVEDYLEIANKKHIKKEKAEKEILNFINEFKELFNSYYMVNSTDLFVNTLVNIINNKQAPLSVLKATKNVASYLGENDLQDAITLTNFQLVRTMYYNLFMLIRQRYYKNFSRENLSAGWTCSSLEKNINLPQLETAVFSDFVDNARNSIAHEKAIDNAYHVASGFNLKLEDLVKEYKLFFVDANETLTEVSLQELINLCQIMRTDLKNYSTKSTQSFDITTPLNQITIQTKDRNAKTTTARHLLPFEIDFLRHNLGLEPSKDIFNLILNNIADPESFNESVYLSSLNDIVNRNFKRNKTDIDLGHAGNVLNSSLMCILFKDLSKLGQYNIRPNFIKAMREKGNFLDKFAGLNISQESTDKEVAEKLKGLRNATTHGFYLGLGIDDNYFYDVDDDGNRNFIGKMHTNDIMLLCQEIEKYVVKYQQEKLTNLYMKLYQNLQSRQIPKNTQNEQTNEQNDTKNL